MKSSFIRMVPEIDIRFLYTQVILFLCVLSKRSVCHTQKSLFDFWMNAWVHVAMWKWEIWQNDLDFIVQNLEKIREEKSYKKKLKIKKGRGRRERERTGPT